MKTITFSLLISFFVISSLKGQDFNKSNMYGRWYLIDTKSGTNIDTMIFKRERIDSSFTQWYFAKNDTLSISSGYIKYFNKDHQYTICSALGRYVISLGDSTDKIKDLKIFKDNYTNVYSILLLDDEDLVLINDKSHEEIQFKKPSKKTRYYFTHADYDSTVFNMDTLVLSVKRINSEYPRIEFYQDSIFCFFYNMDIDTIKTKDKETGLMMEVIIESPETINGIWKTNNMQASLTLIFQDERYIDYSIVNKNDLIYFIRLK